MLEGVGCLYQRVRGYRFIGDLSGIYRGMTKKAFEGLVIHV